MLKSLNLGIYVDKSGYFSLQGTFKNFKGFIIYKNQLKNTKNEIIKSFIFQVYMNKQMNR